MSQEMLFFDWQRVNNGRSVLLFHKLRKRSIFSFLVSSISNWIRRRSFVLLLLVPLSIDGHNGYKAAPSWDSGYRPVISALSKTQYNCLHFLWHTSPANEHTLSPIEKTQHLDIHHYHDEPICSTTLSVFSYLKSEQFDRQFRRSNSSNYRLRWKKEELTWLRDHV